MPQKGLGKRGGVRGGEKDLSSKGLFPLLKEQPLLGTELCFLVLFSIWVGEAFCYFNFKMAF